MEIWLSKKKRNEILMKMKYLTFWDKDKASLHETTKADELSHKTITTGG